MKTVTQTIVMFLFVLLLPACNQNRNQSAAALTNAESRTPAITNPDTLYSRVSMLNPPLAFDDASLQSTGMRDTLPRSMYAAFPNSSEFRGDIRVAKLQATGNIRPIVVLYSDSLNNRAIDMYTLSGTQRTTDRLQLYSVEKNNMPEQTIIRKFNIHADYRIEVWKELNGVLIESLFYQINEAGNFVEIRDGQTPATTFESFDNKTYYVESFIWVQQPNGRLDRTQVRKKTLRVTDDGKVEEVGR